MHSIFTRIARDLKNLGEKSGRNRGDAKEQGRRVDLFHETFAQY